VCHTVNAGVYGVATGRRIDLHNDHGLRSRERRSGDKAHDESEQTSSVLMVHGCAGRSATEVPSSSQLNVIACKIREMSGLAACLTPVG
jgi:hypothetical protein